MLRRLITLPKSSSFFLFGARQTGKSTLINSWLEGKSYLSINLLERETYFRLLREENAFRQLVDGHFKVRPFKILFIDEVQKIPALLDEVQFFIDKYQIQCVLSGSSARKLKRGGANLLGGRARERHLFPLTYSELGDKFVLKEILRFGSLPPIYNLRGDQAEIIDFLNSYISMYLAEEVAAEGIVRRLDSFARFLEIAATYSGGIINFSAIGSAASISAKSVQNYFQILEDTLIGFFLHSYSKSPRSRLKHNPKFYLFDLGVRNALTHSLRTTFTPEYFGKIFEHFVILEVYRYFKYHLSEAKLFYWHTRHGAEVDLLIEVNGELKMAVEIKGSDQVRSASLSGLRSFKEAHPNVATYVVTPYDTGGDYGFALRISWQELQERLLLICS
jgi:predicted AAA+ superfamily ATPase